MKYIMVKIGPGSRSENFANGEKGRLCIREGLSREKGEENIPWGRDVHKDPGRTGNPRQEKMATPFTVLYLMGMG